MGNGGKTDGGSKNSGSSDHFGFKEQVDFKEQARALIRRIAPNGAQGPSDLLSQGLALAAVETALREAYARGAEAARKGRGEVGSSAGLPRGLGPGTRGTALARNTSIAPASAGGQARSERGSTPPECPHEWEEVFLDGRALGARCLDCGVLQTEVQDRCDHYFVQTAGGETCVACRKSKRRGK